MLRETAHAMAPWEVRTLMMAWREVMAPRRWQKRMKVMRRRRREGRRRARRERAGGRSRGGWGAAGETGMGSGERCQGCCRLSGFRGGAGELDGVRDVGGIDLEGGAELEESGVVVGAGG